MLFLLLIISFHSPSAPALRRPYSSSQPYLKLLPLRRLLFLPEGSANISATKNTINILCIFNYFFSTFSLSFFSRVSLIVSSFKRAARLISSSLSLSAADAFSLQEASSFSAKEDSISSFASSYLDSANSFLKFSASNSF